MKTKNPRQFRQFNVQWTQYSNKNSYMGLIQANTAAYMIIYQGKCTNAHFQRQMTYDLNKNIL